MTWPTWVLTCLRDHSYACVNIRGFGHTNSESAQHFWFGNKSISFICAPDGIRTRVLECQVRCSTNWATPPVRLKSLYRISLNSETATRHRILYITFYIRIRERVEVWSMWLWNCVLAHARCFAIERVGATVLKNEWKKPPRSLREGELFTYDLHLRPDITAMVGWQLKINYLSIYDLYH